MMLNLAKRLHEGHLAMQAGRWSLLVGTELFEKTVGLVGFGRIAQAVARRVSGFDTRILAYDPYPNHAAAEAVGARFVDLPELLAQSDYVSLHLPLTEGTRHLIGREALSRMKSGRHPDQYGTRRADRRGGAHGRVEGGPYHGSGPRCLRG